MIETKLTLEEIKILRDNNRKVMIESIDGYSLIDRVFEKCGDGYEIFFNDKTSIKCASGHMMIIESEWKHAHDIKIGDIITNQFGKKIKTVTKKVELPQQMWIDLNVEEEHESYIQNDIIHHNSGKSFIQFIISMIIHKLTGKNVLIIVPSTSLVEQMEFDFLEYVNNDKEFKKNIHKIYSGKSKESKNITISTWQSLKLIPKSFYEDFGGILVDEFHTSEAKVLTSIVQSATKCVYKIGMSGTLKDSKVSTVQLTGLFGDIKTISTSAELIKRGILSELKIYPLILEYDKEITRNLLNDKYTYNEENDFIINHNGRLNIICNLAKRLNKNTLIIFKHIKYGKRLYEELSKNSNKKVFYIAGETETMTREKVRAMTEMNDDVIIIASTQIFSVGINIRNLHNVIFAQSTKSKIKVIQSIGRVLRKHETKSCATIYDIVDDLKTKKKNYSLKHALDRIKFYESENFHYKIKKIKLKGE